MSDYDEEYYCPNCNATLNDQDGFDPDLGIWTCTNCGQTLYGDEIANTMDQFDGVVWYCDSCGAVLNKQIGFSDTCCTWYCTECGHANPINKDEIYESEEDYLNSKHQYSCPNCGALLNDQWGFSEDEEWTCTNCDADLEKDGPEYSVISKKFLCPKCGCTLNEQSNFDEDEEWTCEYCGAHLEKNNDEYYEIDDSYNPYTDEAITNEYNNNFQKYKIKKKKNSGTPKKAKDSANHSSIIENTIENKIRRRIILSLLLFVILFVAYCECSLLIPVKHADKELIGLNYNTVVNTLSNAGFTNIHTHEIEDLTPSELSQKNNRVTEIKIGWSTSFEKTTKLPSNFPVTITYHSAQRISPPMSSKEASKGNYQEVYDAFSKAGFTNIKTEVIYDLITGWLKKDGSVESVVINDIKNFSASSTFKFNDVVIISYHTFKKNKPN